MIFAESFGLIPGQEQTFASTSRRLVLRQLGDNKIRTRHIAQTGQERLPHLG
ncbi:MAG: hypothetical protein AVDCRST_MAG93-1523 [uncultured Chloroflexia bacterium]|uniref:Uncharacterized protein n=1 Tax=uncultured Chloroflexia bacterium TaxID=1672391 RepID=A0A6J4IAS5_9CHLR|nr:MAG: hypothetical protein AVDCRST_MAG93-1523 [uncultured Chloroflexia bacterium]